MTVAMWSIVNVHNVHVHNMYSTLDVQYTGCTVHWMYSTLDVHVVCNNNDPALVTSALSTDIMYTVLQSHEVVVNVYTVRNAVYPSGEQFHVVQPSVITLDVDAIYGKHSFCMTMYISCPPVSKGTTMQDCTAESA